MASEIRCCIVGILVGVVTWSCSTVLYAQDNTELKVYSGTEDDAHLKLGELTPVRRIHPVKTVEKHSRQSDSDTAAVDTRSTFVPPADADPRHKIDSVAAAPAATPATASLVYLEHTDMMQFDSETLPDIQVLVGNVLLRHDDAYLYCDSAHLNRKTNSFDAYGRVRIEQGDSVTIYASALFYDGNARVAHLRRNVRLVNGEVTLATDELTYDRNRKVGYYLCGGTLQDSLNKLVSRKGYYYTDTKEAEFKTDVVGYNDDNDIKSDTLIYNTETKIASILGPTVITHSDSSTIYSEYGWYDTENDVSQLLDRSVITHSEGRTLQGDTIFYDKKAGMGEAFGNVMITDTANSIILTGNYGYYREKNDESLMTDSAMMCEYSQKDTTFVHADTLYAYQMPDSSKIVHLYHNCRLYNPDFQAIADSIYYTSADSVLHLMQMPVLWNEEWQITGDTVDVFPTDGEFNRVHVKENAMIIQKYDSIHYNQMSGREFMAFIGDETLDSLHIMGNAESVFFPNDDDRLIGLNKIKSSYMTIYFSDGKLDRMNVFPSPTANMYPMAQITEQMLRLPNFTWQIEARPVSRDDIFRHPERISQAEIEEQKNAMKEQQKAERRKSRRKRDEDLKTAATSAADGTSDMTSGTVAK
ncbi:MAG: OstA-like protein [Candidatus Aphodosoma sp.]